MKTSLCHGCTAMSDATTQSNRINKVDCFAALAKTLRLRGFFIWKYYNYALTAENASGVAVADAA
jgi:hypothetical protein